MSRVFDPDGTDERLHHKVSIGPIRDLFSANSPPCKLLIMAYIYLLHAGIARIILLSPIDHPLKVRIVILSEVLRTRHAVWLIHLGMTVDVALNVSQRLLHCGVRRHAVQRKFVRAAA